MEERRFKEERMKPSRQSESKEGKEEGRKVLKMNQRRIKK